MPSGSSKTRPPPSVQRTMEPRSHNFRFAVAAGRFVGSAFFTAGTLPVRLGGFTGDEATFAAGVRPTPGRALV